LASVPVIWLDISAEQARLLGLALNRISGSWDDALLARLLADLQTTPDLDLSLSGFGEDEMRDLLRSLEVREKRERQEAFDLDAALEEARRAPRTKPGDLWALGEHRLLCGDATKPEDVARLLDGAAPRLLATDPPYGVSLDQTWRDGVYNGPQKRVRGWGVTAGAERPYMLRDGTAGQVEPEDATRASGGAHGRTRGHRHTTISGDVRADWSAAFGLVPSLQVGYVWYASAHTLEVLSGLLGIGFELVSQIIWDKGLFSIGRSWYHWAHEPCFVVRKPGVPNLFHGERDQATIWRAPSPKRLGAGSREAKEDHPTQKPLVLFETPIRNHLKAGEAVYDPFLGSGTCLIAAERLGAVCHGMEIDPVYVEVALRRWERFSGVEAVRLDA
jgi:DNA modification methylase